MNTAIEFPNSCSTNTYILHDFGEVAYIVCTLAPPATATSSAELPSPEVNLQQLRKTEHQFRQASILAALDVESLQLFTFYKKVDVLKDQRTLLNKFGYVLRSNACTIAYKATARVPDLLKQENARLYRLFVVAVLASIRVLPAGDCLFQSLGICSYLVKNTNELSNDSAADNRLWSLYRTNLQVIISGQVLLTLSSDSTIELVSLSDLAYEVQSRKDHIVPVVIAPVGQIAIYKGGWLGRAVDANQKTWEADPLSVASWHIWHETVSTWLKNEVTNNVDDGEDVWVELQVPVMANEKIEPQPGLADAGVATTQGVGWKTIYWPARKCFTDYFSFSNQVKEQSTEAAQNPIDFIDSWIQSATEREAEAVIQEKQSSDPTDDDEDLLFSDEGPFDNPEHFQPFGPPIFPNSQTVYPTPPDVVMTHATPGMLSVEGLAMTPATISRPGPEIQHQQIDHNNHDLETAQAPGVGSGFYDEDLFEEMPDDNFGDEGTADEPNWDFFDEPDMDVEDTESMNMENQGVAGKVTSRRRSSGVRLGSTDQSSTVQAHSPQHQDPIDHKPAHPTSVSATGPFSQDSLSLRKKQEYQGVEAPILEDVKDQFVEPVRLDTETINANDEHSVISDKQQHARRRSSIYEGISPAMRLGYDTRYSANGEFFFDSNPKSYQTHRTHDSHGLVRRSSAASSSDSDWSRDDDDMDIDKNTTDLHQTHLWQEYSFDSPEATSPVIGVESEQIHEEVNRLFETLKRRTMLIPSSSAFRHFSNSLSRKNDEDNAPVVAQILVDQILQSSLISSSSTHNSDKIDHRRRQDVMVDFTNINPTTTYASLSQLCSVKPANTPTVAVGMIGKLPESRILIQRNEQQLIVSASVLPFWDTLGLQPISSSKNIVAFCMHPAGEGYVEASNNLLARIADAYTSCNLGTHTQGRLAGLSNDGFIAFELASVTGRNLVQTAKRLGVALASASDLQGNILIYMMSQSDTSAAYLECCLAFCTLFKSFMQSRGSRTEQIELILQIIPISFLLSNEAPILPSQTEYFYLALEVYNRLPPTDDERPPASWDYAIKLSNENAKVKFNLAANPQSPFSRYGSCLHVSYDITEDQRWLVAVWSDEQGNLALTMTYFLAESPSKKRARRQETFRDILEVSQDIMKKHRNHWRIVVARVGEYGIDELNDWLHLINSGPVNKEKTYDLYLVATELDPSLKILPLPSPTKVGGTGHGTIQSNLYGTPASTPQASTTSPDQLIPATPTPGGTSALNAPTPPEHGYDPNTESDLTLENPSAESWAVTLPFGTNQSPNIFENRTALLSGYLVKRAGTKDEEGVTMTGIHLIHMPTTLPGTTSISKEEVLEEIINQYRALATLAVTRGSIDALREYIPWHIASAMKGARVLSEVL